MRRLTMMAVMVLAITSDAAAQQYSGMVPYSGLPDDLANCTIPDKAKADPERAHSACVRLAEHGNLAVQLQLGYAYYYGKDYYNTAAPQDYAEAAKWFGMVADEGDALGQSMLGEMYRMGQGVQQSYTEAVKWYRKAADQGNDIAQNNLGVMYMNGQGVPQDYVEAHMWFNLAAARAIQGDTLAAKNRALVAAKMTSSQIEKAQALAAAWKPTTGQ